MSPAKGGTCQSSALAGTTSSWARKQQRRARAPALEAQHEAAPVGRFADDLAVQTGLAKPGVHELGHRGLVAGRVAGVDPDEPAQQLAGLALPPRPTSGRVDAGDVHVLPSSASALARAAHHSERRRAASATRARGPRPVQAGVPRRGRPPALRPAPRFRRPSTCGTLCARGAPGAPAAGRPSRRSGRVAEGNRLLSG